MYNENGNGGKGRFRKGLMSIGSNIWILIGIIVAIVVGAAYYVFLYGGTAFSACKAYVTVNPALSNAPTGVTTFTWNTGTNLYISVNVPKALGLPATVQACYTSNGVKSVGQVFQWSPGTLQIFTYNYGSTPNYFTATKTLVYFKITGTRLGTVYTNELTINSGS